MRSRCAIAVAAAALAGAALPAPGAGASPAAGSRLLVYAQEWSLWPSRASVAAGTVSVQLWNRGQDPHNLRVRRLRHGHMVGRTQGVAVVDSGAIAGASWRLAPGTYELYCSLAAHAHLGMRTRLVVR